jgi:hypothetical protein
MFCLVSGFFFLNNFTFVLTFCVFLKTLMVLLNTPFTLCHCVTKRVSIFWFILVFGSGLYFQTDRVFFCSRMAKGGVC